MKRIKIFVIAAVAAVATTLPVSASATATPPSALAAAPEVANFVAAEPWVTAAVDHQRPGACRHAWMHIFASVAVRTEPRADAPSLGNVGPANSPCRHFQPGGGYPATACGPANTGWVLIPVNPYPRQGWIVSQCTEDPIL